VKAVFVFSELISAVRQIGAHFFKDGVGAGDHLLCCAGLHVDRVFMGGITLSQAEENIQGNKDINH
jgi:hypothetical protein